MNLDDFAATVLVLVAQRVRAQKGIPNVVSVLLVVLVAIGLFWFKDSAAGVAVFAQKAWWQSTAVWAAAILGGSRVAADLGLLPKTNSLGGSNG